MASNVAIKISADVVDVEAKFAVASARVREFNSELNKLAREASTTGVTDALRQQMLGASESLLQAKNQAAALSQELKSNSEPAMRSFGEQTAFAREALGAFGIGLSIGGIVRFADSLADSAAQIEHQADVLGLSVTAFQAFTESAKLAGTPVDVVEAALKRFNVAQGEAQAGSKLQAEAFRDLGVSAEGTGADTLPRVSRQLLDIGDTAQQARLGMIIFGRQFQEMRPFIEQWAQGADALAKKNAELGLSLDPAVTAASKSAEIRLGIFYDRLRADWTPTAVAAKTAIADVIDAFQGLGSVKLPDWFLGPGIEGKGILAARTAGPAGLPFANEATQSIAVPSSIDVTRNALSSGGKSERTGVDHARQIADEQVQIWETASQKRIEGEQQANAALLALGNESLEQFRDQAKRLEDARYQAALGGLQARTEIDKGDAVALARDNAEMEVLAVDHANKLAAIDNRYEEDHLRAVKEATDKESALRQAAFNADFAARQEQARLEITQIQQTNTEIEAINRQEVAAKRAAMQEIGAVEGQLARAIISGRQNVGQIATQLAQTLLEKEITADLEYLTEREAINLGILASDQATAQQGLLFKLAAWAAEKLGLVSATAAEEVTTSAKNLAVAESNIAVAATGAAASQAFIPIIGPELAIAAAASTEAALQPFAGLASLDVGTNFIPRTGLYQLHEGEAVTPARYNPSAGGGGGSGDTHIHFTHSPTINAPQNSDIHALIRAQPQRFVSAFMELARGGYLKLG